MMQCPVAFDSLAYVKKLREVGVPEKQAEVQAEAFYKIIEERLATKQDIRALNRDIKEMETSLKRDMKELETSLKHDMKELETSLKHDMKELETSLKHDNKELELSFRRDMKDLEMRLTLRMGAMLATGIIIIAAMVKLL